MLASCGVDPDLLHPSPNPGLLLYQDTGPDSRFLLRKCQKLYFEKNAIFSFLGFQKKLTSSRRNFKPSRYHIQLFITKGI
jgi:hypothetical protein